MLSHNHVSSALPRRLRNLGLFLVCLLIAIVCAERGYTQVYDESPLKNLHTPQVLEYLRHEKPLEVTLVVASMTTDNTTWAADSFTDWQKAIYVTNDPNAELTVPQNKGAEGQVYLTYIIDHYDHLPDVAIFSHANRYQWHNDDPLYDGQDVLSRLQIPYVQSRGYANLRCAWTLGCPIEIRPHEDANRTGEDAEQSAGTYFRQAFEYMFPGEAVPEGVGVPCCAQFAVSKQRIQERPKSDYLRYRTWLLETNLNDHLSGRIFEYLWHIIFGQDSVHCPTARHCYCKTFGLCNLKCEEAGTCNSVYQLPSSLQLADDWPFVDQHRTRQDVDQSRANFEETYHRPWQNTNTQSSPFYPSIPIEQTYQMNLENHRLPLP